MLEETPETVEAGAGTGLPSRRVPLRRAAHPGTAPEGSLQQPCQQREASPGKAVSGSPRTLSKPQQSPYTSPPPEVSSLSRSAVPTLAPQRIPWDGFKKQDAWALCLPWANQDSWEWHSGWGWELVFGTKLSPFQPRPVSRWDAVQQMLRLWGGGAGGVQRFPNLGAP